MAEPLALLLDDGVIDEVYTRLKTGKEAEIYLVRHAGEVVAAKVYKERNQRNFKNNATYMEGRRVRNTRTQRAIDKGSRFGQASAEQAWKAKESEALHKLHAAGVRVPRPVMFYEGVLLMEAVLDSDGRPAPRLIEAAIPREKAAEWYADLRSQAVKMLCCDLVHGDLSPYNVLAAWNGPTIIDFPQVVGAAHNSQAERFFIRDLENIRRFFAQHDPALHAAAGDAREIWRAFVRRELTPDFVPTGRALPHAPPGERRHEGRRGDGHGGRPHEHRHGEQRNEPRHERRAPPSGGQPHGGGRPHPQGDRRGAGQPPHGRGGEGQPHARQDGGDRREHAQREAGRQGRPHGRPQQRGGPDRRGGDARGGGSPGPQVTVVQRLPGVAPSHPRRDGGHGGGQGQGEQGQAPEGRGHPAQGQHGRRGHGRPR